MPEVAGGFLPHGFCYLWNKPLLHTHLWSDVLIGLSYVAISFSLAWLVHRARRDIPFSTAFVAFGLFIITCGITHFMEVWTLWEPVYWLSGGMKVVTAAASVSTAIAMPFWVPRVHMTIRDAKFARQRALAEERAKVLEETNAQLQEQAMELEQQREEAEILAEELEQANAELRAALAAAETAQEAAERARREAEDSRALAEEARKAADTANRAKSDFLATMSHELRTPLNAINGYAELLELGVRGPLSESQLTDVRRIRRSQQQLLKLVNDVLNFARIEAGRIEFDIEEIQVADVFSDVELAMETQLAQKGVGFEILPAPPELRLRADRDRIQQILLNLTSNALKFTKPGGRVMLDAREEEGPAGPRVIIRVVDDGLGIAPDQLERIFEPFVQVEGGLTRESGGAGLGLSISRDLARAMGGDLRVESTVGAGSTFLLELPA